MLKSVFRVETKKLTPEDELKIAQDNVLVDSLPIVDAEGSPDSDAIDELVAGLVEIGGKEKVFLVPKDERYLNVWADPDVVQAYEERIARQTIEDLGRVATS